MTAGAVVHCAGQAMVYGRLLRQRCGWCGALLLEGNADDFNPWPFGTWVQVDGEGRAVDARTVDVRGDVGCTLLDPDVTR